MIIKYRAVYEVISQHYIRRSLRGYIQDFVGADIFSASVVMAHQLEDYQYLQVMVSDIDDISKNYVFFVKDGELPVVLEAEKDFTLTEFAIFASKTGIDIEHFQTCVHDTAIGCDCQPKEKMEQFEHLYKMFSNNRQ